MVESEKQTVASMIQDGTVTNFTNVEKLEKPNDPLSVYLFMTNSTQGVLVRTAKEDETIDAMVYYEGGMYAMHIMCIVSQGSNK